jgi:hypothetical protein
MRKSRAYARPKLAPTERDRCPCRQSAGQVITTQKDGEKLVTGWGVGPSAGDESVGQSLQIPTPAYPYLISTTLAYAVVQLDPPEVTTVGDLQINNYYRLTPLYFTPKLFRWDPVNRTTDGPAFWEGERQTVQAGAPRPLKTEPVTIDTYRTEPLEPLT